MSAALNFVRIWKDQGVTWREYQVVLSGNYANQAANPNEVIDFTKAVNVNNLPQMIPGQNPILHGVSNQPVGLHAKTIPGTTIKNWSLEMQYKDAANPEFTEKANGEAYTAATIADIHFKIRIGTRSLCG